MGSITIGNRFIGDEQPIFIIAEAGVNHNGDIDMAKKMIRVAKNAGADAVKFQTFHAEKVMLKTAEKAEYQKETTGAGESQYEMVKKLELGDKDFKELSDYAVKQTIMFLSSPFDKASADVLARLDVPAYKIASGEINNFPLVRHIAKKKKPVILSTGMATLGDIEQALAVIRTNGVPDVALLHCVTSYPAKAETLNLRAMKTMKRAFGVPVGLSDHTEGTAASIAAAALGASIIEKHFTLDRDLPGPDHKASADPETLASLVRDVRLVEQAMGDGRKMPTKEEEVIVKVARRSVVSSKPIPRGTIIRESMLDTRRPGTGIEPRYLDWLVGKKAKKDIGADIIITMDMISL